jgi:hypothetical protein
MYENAFPRGRRRPPRHRRAVAALVLAGLVSIAATPSCYRHETPTSDEIATLSLPMDPVIADGVNVVPISVSVDPRTPNTTAIVIVVSTGIVNFAAAPTDSSARQLSIKNDGTGHLSTPWAVGTHAGDAVVEVTVGGAVRSQSLTLVRSAAAHLSLSFDVTALKADGVAHAQATVTLIAADPSRSVSDGTVVRLAVCCPDSTGAPASCAMEPPLAFPPQVTAAGTTVTATVTTQAKSVSVGDAGPLAPIRAFLVASTSATVSCTPPAADAAQAWASEPLALIPTTASN